MKKLTKFSTIVGAAALVLISQAAAQQSAQPIAAIKEITHQVVDNQLEAIIKIDGEFTYETFELTSPTRLVIDLTAVQDILVEPSMNIDEMGVLKVRTGRFKPEVARVVFELAEKAPSHTISRIPDGLKVLFWMEEARKAEKVPEAIKEESVIPKKIEKEVPKRETARATIEKTAEIALQQEKKFFVQIRAGLGLFPKPNNRVQRTDVIYGENGTLTETYKFKTILLFDASFGKFFDMKGKKVKGGLGASLWPLKHDGNFEASIPHPFIENSPRTFAFQEPLKNTIYNFYVFALFPMMSGEKTKLYLGPSVGFATGKLSTLQDYEIEDKSPFSNTDIKLISATYIDDTISGLSFEGRLDFEYAISPSISLVLEGIVSYFNPKVTNLGKRANFLQAQLVLGFQFNL